MFQLVSELNILSSNAPQVITGLTKTDLLIEFSASNTFRNGDLIEGFLQGGKVFGIKWIQDSTKGSFYPLEYGQNEINLNIPKPLEPFDLEIVPNRYQFSYSVKIYQRAFNPAYQSLTEKLGIPLEILERIPESTLILLESIDLMANTDTRTTLAKIEAINAKSDQALQAGQDAQSTADLTANSLAEAKTEMVLDRRFELTQAMFVQESGFMVADVIHDLTAGKPQMSLTDAQGDDQGFAQLIAKSPTVARVELSMTQYNDNSYPMSFLLQGSKGSASVATALLGASGRSVSLINGDLMVSVVNGSALEFNAFRDTVGGAIGGILEAVILPSGAFHVKAANDTYYGGFVNSWVAVPSNSGNHDNNKATVGAIVL